MDWENIENRLMIWCWCSSTGGQQILNSRLQLLGIYRCKIRITFFFKRWVQLGRFGFVGTVLWRYDWGYMALVSQFEWMVITYGGLGFELSTNP